MFNCEELEGRSQPAVLASSGGDVVWGQTQFHAFPDYYGPLSVAQAGDLNGNGTGDVVVGAGEGGGPRVRVVDGGPAHAVLADFFAFEPSFRGGVRVAVDGADLYAGAGPGGAPVVADYDADTFAEKSRRFVGDPGRREGVTLDGVPGTYATAPPPPVAPPPAFDVPDLTYGDLDNPNVWRIYLSFEHPFSADWATRVAAKFWELVEPLGNVAVTTVRPGDYPGNYGTVVIGADLSFTGDEGDTVARWDEPHPNWFDGGVYVDTRLAELGGLPQQPEDVAVVAAHEAGHALGLEHNATLPYNVMSSGHVSPDETFTPQDVLAARAGAASAVSLKYKLDASSATA